MMLIILVLSAALSLAVTAAYFSITGIGHMFSAIFVAAVVMGGVLEFGKLAATSWLYQMWDDAPKWLRAGLLTSIGVLMIITSLGIFGFLSKGYLDVQNPVEQKNIELSMIVDETTNIRERMLFIDEEIKSYREELSILQKQVNDIPKNQVTKRRETYENQQPRRKELGDLLNRAIDKKSSELQNIKSANINKAQKSVDISKAEADIGPIKYVASFFGMSNDAAIKMMIILITIVFDPLAVMLVVAANISIAKKNKTNKGSLLDILKKSPSPVIEPINQSEIIEPINQSEIIEPIATQSEEPISSNIDEIVVDDLVEDTSIDLIPPFTEETIQSKPTNWNSAEAVAYVEGMRNIKTTHFDEF